MISNNEYLRVELEGGKYTFIQHNDGSCETLRYGESWRDCVGDCLILCMAQEIDNLRTQLKDKSC